MADRNEKVTISGDASGLVAALKQADNALKDLVADSSKQSKQSGLAAASQTAAWDKMASSALKGGALIGAGVGVALTAYASFSDRMAQVKSLQEVSSSQFKQLSNDALSLGTNFGLSANDVADAEIEMAKAGISVTDQLNGGLKGALSLAAAGQISVGDATSYATIAMTQFGLKGSDIPHLADLMAAGADKALGSVQDLGEALSNGGLQASSFGLSIEDTIGTLAMFAQNGLIGAEAGTQMKSMFQKLQNPTKESSDLMKKLGLSVYDSSGKFVGITKFAGELHDKLSGLTQAQQQSAMATIFGSYAINGATVLMKEGAKGTQEWINKVNDSGFAAKQAAGKMDSLAGDAKKFTAALQTSFIKAGSTGNDVARDVVQSATKMVKAIGEIPEPVLKTGMAVAALSSAGLIAVGTIMKVTTAVANFQKANAELAASGKIGSTIAGLNSSAGNFIGTMGKMSPVIAAAAAGAAGFMYVAQNLQKWIDSGGTSIKRMTTELKNSGDAMKVFKQAFSDGMGSFLSAATINGISVSTKNMNAWVSALNEAKLEQSEVSSSAQRMSGHVQTNTTSVNAAEKGIGKWRAAMATLAKSDMPAAVVALNNLKNQGNLTTSTVDDLIGKSGKYHDALVDIAKQAGQSTSQENLRRIALGESSAVTDAATNSAAGYNKALLDSQNTALSWHSSLNALDDMVKNNSHTFDLNTSAGVANMQMMNDAAGKSLDYAASLAKQGHTAGGVNQILDESRKKFYDTALAMTGSTDQAEKLTDKYMGLSQYRDIAANVKLNGGEQVTTTINGIQYKYAQLPNGKTTLIKATDTTTTVINGVHYKIKTLPNGKEILIKSKDETDAENKKAESKHEATVQRSSGRPIRIKATDNTGAGLKSAEERVSNGVHRATNNAKILIRASDKTKSDVESAQRKVDSVKQDHAAALRATDKTASGVRDARSTLNSLKDKWVTIHAKVVQEKAGGGPVFAAAGGGIHGPGSGTSDSIPAMLSNGEHVWTAREVQAAGGQGAVYALRAMALSGRLREAVQGKSAGYATGGAVYSSPRQTVVIDRGETSSPQINVPISQTIVSRDPYVEATVWGRDLRRELGGLV